MTQPNGPILLTELVQNHAAHLYRYAYRLSGSSADAEDLVQQTFVIAQQNLPSLRDPNAARAWLFALLRTAFNRLVRKPRPIPQSVVQLELDELVAPQEPPTELDAEALQSALLELPEEHRVVVLGFYFEECSYQELATQLEIPIGTVMSRLSRAKQFLRERLTPVEPVANLPAPQNDKLKPKSHPGSKRPQNIS